LPVATYTQSILRKLAVIKNPVCGLHVARGSVVGPLWRPEDGATCG